MPTWPPTNHQDVEDDLTNAHGWAATLTQRERIGEMQKPTGGFLWVAGRYYNASMFSTSTTFTPGAGAYFLPFYTSRPRSVDRVGFSVSTAGSAGQIARVGIYNADPDTYFPSTVLVDGGTLAVDTTGVKEATISTTISGLVWFYLQTQGGVISAYNSTMLSTIVGTTAQGAASYNVLYNNSAITTTTALASYAAFSSWTYGTGTQPAISVRAA